MMHYYPICSFTATLAGVWPRAVETKISVAQWAHTAQKQFSSTYYNTVAYILNDGNSEVLHVLNDNLLLLWNLGMLNQLGQILFSNTFTHNAIAVLSPSSYMVWWHGVVVRQWSYQ